MWAVQVIHNNIPTFFNPAKSAICDSPKKVYINQLITSSNEFKGEIIITSEHT